MSDLRKYDPSLLDRANTAIDPSQYKRGSFGRFGANLAQNAMDLLGVSDASYVPDNSGFGIMEATANPSRYYIPEWEREALNDEHSRNMTTMIMNSIDVPEVKAVKNVAKRIMTPEIKAKNLERFLEGSKVREPVYHGTNAKFDVFNSSIMEHGREHGNGLYLTTDKNRAGSYGNDVMELYIDAKNPLSFSDPIGVENSKRISNYLSDLDGDMFENSSRNKVYGDPEYIRELFQKEKQKYLTHGNGVDRFYPEIGQDEDGIFLSFMDNSTGIDPSEIGENVYRNLKSKYGESINDHLGRIGFDAIKTNRDYIVFNPTQIKSATGNRGTFDPTDPNILHSIAPISLARYNTQKEE